MITFETILNRHSVRAYLDKELSLETIQALEEKIEACNKAAKLHIQLVTNEKTAFNGLLARYGKFSNVSNYIVLVGKKRNLIKQDIGYYGEELALFAQSLGLNTCWVAMSYSSHCVKKYITLEEDEAIYSVLALGYGKTQGSTRKSKTIEDLSVVDSEMPSWFIEGMKAVQLAPSALNKQPVRFYLKGQEVKAKALGGGYSQIDLGIAKYHFEIIASKENFVWNEE